MCTVSFLPLADRVLITSNRDEQPGRPSAILPHSYSINNQELLFPKDAKACGTWIGVHENKGIAVLFNGAFRAHRPAYPYRKSRGLIFLDLVTGRHKRFQDNFNDISLDLIEPFSIIFYQDGMLWENRWDGQQKHSCEIDPLQAHLWGSATIYSSETVNQRITILRKWLSRHKSPAMEDLLQLHASDFILGEHPLLQTVSITSIELKQDAAEMAYLDLAADDFSRSRLSFRNSLAFQP
ncbi:NRDE family protein [Flavihumibacter petaseus]|uniref:NRDE family protein n=1 Tax=Flavihumibacter petaseus NBRC 106054 TaxID=1220578 RepID=A0A0E9N4X2_9BACT|nr:NRDE family protein [Flavihumibacter petaseus]GAO44395.1 hypothetical protein FPE01S_03_04330 [Flavihumibacter petaseus NBRC 106054]